jgi:hypothetical protein
LHFDSYDALKKLVEDSKFFDASKANSIADHEQCVNEATKRLEFITGKIKFNLINVFRLDTEEDSHDIEMSILTAFLNCKC